MKDEELKQVLLNAIQLGEEQKLNQLTVYEVAKFMKRNYQLEGRQTNDLLTQLRYDDLIEIREGCVIYKGYEEKYPVIGE